MATSFAARISGIEPTYPVFAMHLAARLKSSFQKFSFAEAFGDSSQVVRRLQRAVLKGRGVPATFTFTLDRPQNLSIEVNGDQFYLPF